MPFRYNKLIRDKVLANLSKLGKKFVMHQASNDEEYWMKLKQKLQEEINEFGSKQDIDSLADIYEVLNAIAEFKKFDPKEIQAVRENKAIEFGTFNNRSILDEAEVDLKNAQDPLL